MKDKPTTADLIIDFLGNLQGVDQLMSMVEEPRTAVIDLNTAAIIEADPGFPDGDMLICSDLRLKRARPAFQPILSQE